MRKVKGGWALALAFAALAGSAALAGTPIERSVVFDEPSVDGTVLAITGGSRYTSDGRTVQQVLNQGIWDGTAYTKTWVYDDAAGGKGGAALYAGPDSIDFYGSISIGSVTIDGYDITYNHNAAADGNAYGMLYLVGVVGGDAVTINPTAALSGLTVSNNTLTMNIIADAGVSSTFGAGGRIIGMKQTTITGSAFTGNQLVLDAAAGSGASAHANGGALAVESEWGAAASITANFTGNTVSASGAGLGAGSAVRGGALYLASTNDEPDAPAGTQGGSGLAAAVSGTFTGNEAVMNGIGLAGGGAVNAENAVTLTVTGARFEDNAALSSGGRAEGGAVRLNLKNYSDHMGYGTYDGYLTPLGNDSDSGKDYYASFDAVSFSENTAEGNLSARGGAVFYDLTINTVGSTAFTGPGGMFLNNVSFTDNEAVSASGTAQGGAIYTTGDLIMSDVTFTGNTVTDTAGTRDEAVYLAGTANAYFIGSGLSTDNDGISSAGTANTIVKYGSGSLELFGDYSGFQGDVDVNGGTVYFRGSDITNILGFGPDLSQSFSGDLYLNAGEVSLLRASDASGALVRFRDIDLTAGTKMTAKVLTIGDGTGGTNETAHFVYTGTVTDAGALYRIAGEMTAGEQYVILRDDANSSGYASSPAELVAGLFGDYWVHNDGTAVWAELESARGLADYAITRNNTAIAESVMANKNSNLYKFFVDSGWEASDAAKVNRTLELAHGEIGASTVTALLTYAQRNADLMIRQAASAWEEYGEGSGYASVRSGTGYASAAAYSAMRPRVWADFDGYYGKSSDRSDTYRGTARSWGFGLGADIVNGDWLFGGGFRYGDGRLKVDHLLSRSDYDSYTFSLYAGRRICLSPGTLYLTAGYSFGYNDIDYRRRDIAGGSYRADFDGYAHTAYLDAAFGIKSSENVEWKPFANLMYNALRNQSYTERARGGINAPLSVASRTQDNLSTSLGLRVKATAGCVFADASIAWRHTYGSVSPANRTRFVASNTAFSVHGNALARDEAVYAVGAGVNITPKASLRLGYDGSAGKKTYTHRGTVSFDLKF